MANGLKKLLMLSAIISTGIVASAQTELKSSASVDSTAIINISESLNASDNIHLNQSEELTRILDRKEFVAKNDGSEDGEQNGVRQSRTGFRVEVFADNNVRTAKAQATSKKNQIESRFPQYRVYLVFEAPFWRVRLGDFSNRGGAESALAEVKAAFPELRDNLRIVRSSINQN